MDNNKQIILTGTTPQELAELIQSGVKVEIEKLGKRKPFNEDEDLLTREETFKFLKVDSSTLWAWTKKGKVKAYGIGSRVYYKKSELLQSLTQIKQS